MEIVCLDLEGVLIPEIWVEFAEHTGIKKLAMTTRDIPIYEDLMDQRLSLLKENRLTVRDIQAVIGKMKPLPGAVDFLNQIASGFTPVWLQNYTPRPRPKNLYFVAPSLRLCHPVDM